MKVKSVNRSFKFYKSFGFNEIFAYGRPEFLSQLDNIPTAREKYNGVVFGIGDSLFVIADGHLAVKPKVFKEMIFSSKISAMLYVSSVKNVEKVCKKFKYKIASSIRDYPWGTKEIVIKDPDGFVLVFIERLKK